MAFEEKERNTGECSESPRGNIRCRKCRVVNGYGPDEHECRSCGAALCRADVI